MIDAYYEGEYPAREGFKAGKLYILSSQWNSNDGWNPLTADAFVIAESVRDPGFFGAFRAYSDGVLITGSVVTGIQRYRGLLDYLKINFHEASGPKRIRMHSPLY